jgi:hypothetical protein
MKIPSPDRSLDALESELLARIAAHRVARKTSATLSVALLLAFTALAGGVVTGITEPRHKTAGSEAALLAEDAGLAPSSLLASNQ